MIYDTFIFFNELELLDIRLHELANVVDRFVLVEATKTFSNKPKPLFYAENKERFNKFNNKIIHTLVDDMPNAHYPWIIERFQRNCISRAFGECQPDDIILVSDVDEIPRASKVLEYSNHPGIKVFQQSLYYYFLNCTGGSWNGTRMLSYKDFTSAQEVRHADGLVIEDGGWHFSYMGGVDRIRQKIAAYSHQEYNTPEYTDPKSLSDLVNRGKDLFYRSIEWRFVEIDATYPDYILSNLELFADWIKESTMVFGEHEAAHGCQATGPEPVIDRVRSALSGLPAGVAVELEVATPRTALGQPVPRQYRCIGGKKNPLLRLPKQ